MVDVRRLPRSSWPDEIIVGGQTSLSVGLSSQSGNARIPEVISDWRISCSPISISLIRIWRGA